MTRAMINIVKWLPLEAENNLTLFVECKQLQIEADNLVENLGIFLNDLKRRNIKKLYTNSIDIPFGIDDLELIVLKMRTIIDSYNKVYLKLKVNHPKITYFRMEKTKDILWKIKLKLSYLLQHLVSKIAHLFVYYGDRILEITLTLSNMFNQCIKLDEKYVKHISVCSNTSAYLLYPLRKMSVTKILQIMAQNRAETCCHQLIDCLLNTYKANENHDDETSSNSSVEIYRALTKHMTPSKEEQSPIIVQNNDPQNELENKFESPDKCSDITNDTRTSENFSSMEDMIASEENNVILLLNMTMQITPHFLGNEGIRKNKNGEMKINTKSREKVLDYYEKILWADVGNYLEHIILWWGPSPLSIRPPHSSQHLREWIQQFIPTVEIPGFILSALQTLADALGVHVTSTSWDQNFRYALVAAKKANDPSTGRLFSEMLHDLVSLSNQCEMTSEWIVGAPLEDLPLVEQIPILHRLDHSIHTTRMWAQIETKRLANNWNVHSFFILTQSDIANCLLQLNDLKLVDHSEEISKGGLKEHTNVCANMRAKLVSEVQDNVIKLKQLPKECLNCLATVCRTVSLANLQMIFPDAKYWRLSRYEIPDVATPYVATFLDRVLSPVLAATDNEQISNMVLKIMCEAWLDHIYMNKIRFTQHGACQLLRDFASVADWLTDCSIIKADTRNKMIKNEVLRRCEGVGRLLLRSPGEQIKMTDKNKQVEQNTNESPMSENGTLMPAEMYVPNQEQWLELRASKKKNIFISSCCC